MKKQNGVKTSGPKRLSPLSLDRLDRKDSYFQSKPTVDERKEWLLQSIVPLLGLLLTLFFTMIIYEIPSIHTEAASFKPREIDIDNDAKPSEACLPFSDFHRYLDRPEDYEAFYCDANTIPNNQSSLL